MPDFKIRLQTEVDEGTARSQLEKLVGEFNKDPIKIQADVGDTSKKITQLANDLKNLKKIASEIKIGGTTSGGTDNVKKQTDSWLSQFKKLTNEYNALQKQLSKETNVKSIEVLKKQIEEVGTAMNEAKGKISDANKEIANSFEQTSSRKLETSFVKTFDNISSQAESLGKKINNAFNDANFNTDGLNKVKSEFETLQNSIKNFDMSNMTGESVNKLVNDLNKVQTEFKNLSTAANQVKLENKFDIDCTKAIGQLNKLKAEYESLGKDSSGIDNMINDINRLQSEIGSVDLGKLKNEFNSISKQMTTMKSEVSGALMSVRGNWDDFTSSLSAFTIGNLAGDAIASALYGVKDTIIELDNAFRDLAKVADEDMFSGTAEEMSRIKSEAADMANSVGTTMTEMINSTASAVQLGINDMSKAMEYAKNVTMFANVSDQEVSVADEQLKGILSSFGGINEALKSNQSIVKGAPSNYTKMMDTLDQLNYLGNNFAVTSGDMSEALSRFANVASTSGITVDQALSYAMATQESVQNSEKVGNGLNLWSA